MLGGAQAGALFNRIWRALADQDEAPEPSALEHRTREVLVAAVLQGAVSGLVKAVMDRAAAMGYRRVTGSDPAHERFRPARSHQAGGCTAARHLELSVRSWLRGWNRW